ncbi:phosphopantetheine-binding protein [Mycoplasma leonicaptivi]|uniref:phosphopantetheine-binding protein n=1 Tax=Mycoplasma leonicaptivi TaxID=36742 RepID=UPI0004842FA0|nr:phosphopantetheine-binding protein [Mycoplasma leonicaptivi]
MKNIENLVLEKVSQIAKKKVFLDDDIKKLNIDSLDVAEIIIDTEEEFNITITDEELMSIKFVKDIVRIVSSKIN